MEPSIAGWAALALAAAAGAALQAATGFGFAILAAPVFLGVLKSTSAVPILIALHVVQCLFTVPRVWAHVPWRDFKRLASGAVLGCPFGLLLFRFLDVRQLKLCVGIVILVVTALLAWRRLRSTATQITTGNAEPQPGADTARVVTGALSGVLTAVLVMPGPPLMVNLLRNPLPAARARALSLSFFAACYLAVLIVHAASGELNGPAASIIGWLVVPVIAGTCAGLHAMRWLAERHFAPLMTALLLAAGLGAILSAL
ncbi:MAG: sulfite exporter TauE/SafE family protein [Hyphomicrobiaceae bacterium]